MNEARPNTPGDRALSRNFTREVNQRPQSSSASRFTAGASWFLNFTQSGDRPDRWRDPSLLETIPSKAGVAEDEIGIGVLQVLIQTHPWRLLRRMLARVAFTHLDRLPPKVPAVELQEVESVQKRQRLIPAVA
jgi:hypothetical protein